MRISIEITVTGQTIEELEENAVKKWNSLNSSNDTQLPEGAELVIESVEGSSEYRARALFRAKR